MADAELSVGDAGRDVFGYDTALDGPMTLVGEGSLGDAMVIQSAGAVRPQAPGGGGSVGDVSRNGATIDNRISRWHGTNAEIQNSVVGIDDDGNVTGYGTLTGGGSTIQLTSAAGLLLVAAIEQDGASVGQVLEWTGSQWEPGITPVGGSGTINTIPRFTPDGKTLGDSDITDDGFTTTVLTNDFVVPNGFVAIGGELLVNGHVTLQEEGDSRAVPSDTDPRLRVYSSDEGEGDDYIDIYHNQAQAMIETPGLFLRLRPDFGTQFDSFSAASNSFSYLVDGTEMLVMKFFPFAAQISWNLADAGGNQLVIGPFTARDQDYDHPLATDPTLFIHSDTNPNSDNTEWISLTHDKTNGVFGLGSGAYTFPDGDVEIGIGDLTVTLGDLFVLAGQAGIGTGSPDGTLHVHTGSAGAVTAHTTGDEGVFENSAEGGISLLGPDANFQNIFLGSPSEARAARIRWKYDDLKMQLGTVEPGSTVDIWSGEAGVGIRIDPSQNVAIPNGDCVLSEFLILPKASGNGIKVDTIAPTFGFADLLGDQFSRNTGPTKPTQTSYNGPVQGWQFAAGDEAFMSFHIPHDYVKGTDIFLHIHWSHIGTLVVGGSVIFKATSIYAKGHNQAAFTSVPASGTFTGNASTTQYQQIITEALYSASSPTGIQLDTDLLEPDGVIEMTFEVDANNITVSSGGVPDPFIHFVDIHYQSTGLIGTKDKVPDFYS